MKDIKQSLTRISIGVATVGVVCGLLVFSTRAWNEHNELNFTQSLPLGTSVISELNRNIEEIKELKIEEELTHFREQYLKQLQKEEEARREEEAIKRKKEKRSREMASRGMSLEGRKYRIEKLIVTAYAPFDNKSGICNDGDPTKTSTGSYPQHGTIAVNPKKFPYGTKFYIEGYSYGVAEDTGGAMRKNPNKIDVFMETYDDAKAWGVREIDVIVFED